MTTFVDRRLNPKDKSLGNRQRFLRRARGRLKEVVDQSIRDRKVGDMASGETITIPTKGIDEPKLVHNSKGGRRTRVFPGNKEFVSGDTITKPKPKGGDGAGKEGAEDGEGEDGFQFVLTRDEFLDLFFDGLELPDLEKTDLQEILTSKPVRAGHSSSGTPVNMDIGRTMRNSFARRMALGRPRSKEMAALEVEIAALEARGGDEAKLTALRQRLEALDRRRRMIPFIDPLDIRYNRFEQHPEPNSQAVMFCLMDVSGSMGEREKDLAKRFFVLLHMFLERRYERTEIVFIRHTHEASEVDEETFFYSRETGGTVVSTALKEMLKVQEERYPPGEWNIYAAQASDGENFTGDSARCVDLLSNQVMELCQYYAYIEIVDEREAELVLDSQSGAALWRSYRTVGEQWSNFAMKRIARAGDIYPVFRELFLKTKERAGAGG